MKSDVLKDLPPKITQDYYCDLSPVQIKLYEDFTKAQEDKLKLDSAVATMAAANSPTNMSSESGAGGKSKTHIFQVRYLFREAAKIEEGSLKTGGPTGSRGGTHRDRGSNIPTPRYH